MHHRIPAVLLLAAITPTASAAAAEPVPCNDGEDWLSAGARHALKHPDLILPTHSPRAPAQPYDRVHRRVPGTADRETCAAGGTDDAR
jgi:hypothetical protein